MNLKHLLLLSVLVVPAISYAAEVVTDSMSGNSAILGIGNVKKGCKLHFGVYGIDSISQDENDSSVSIIRFSNYPDKSISIEAKYGELSPISRTAAQKLLKVGDVYTIRFSVCEAKSIPVLIDAYKQSF